MLTQPWQGGDFNPTGVAFAALAAAAWGFYILLTQRIGDRFTGIGALTLTVPIAAVAAAVVGIPQPSAIQVVGILLVVLAGAAAKRGGRRRPAKEQSASPADLDFVG